MAFVYLVFFALICSATAVMPNYSPAIQADGLSRDEIIEKYFHLGLSNAEILGFIVNFHGIRLSLRQLKRILRRRKCKRRNDQDNLEDVVCAIENELKGSGSVIGWSRIPIKTPIEEKDLRGVGLFDDDDLIQRECIKFCFMEIIQIELHKVARNWNTHRIRPSNNAESPPGRPNVLYFNPEILGSQDYLIPVDIDEREIAEEMCCTQPSPRGCSDEFNALAEMIMEDEGLQMPTNANEGKGLYITLLRLIEETENDE
ncbi:Hypothetical predicted protein [Paramuricea clavata]|uniref:Uncharacterized protein n=1 Tax=Paramuricea clavata TaxID=317549 RepID=A0A7D9JDS8_PARCT|nr:Hypothetical predicted protein [Paramuricea clavata]